MCSGDCRSKSVRRLVTVFGAFAIPRFVYGSRPGQKIELAATDQRVATARRRDVVPAAGLEPADERRTALRHGGQVVAGRSWGSSRSVDTLEHGNRQMAEAAAAFRAAQPPPDPEAEGNCWSSARTTRGFRWSRRWRPRRSAHT